MSLGAAGAQADAKPVPDLAAGRAAYEQNCARCHGATGAGDGRDAKRFFPRPRNFTAGTYKFRTTASGTAPSDDDLFHTLTHGLAGSGMPDWQHLDQATRWQLVYYLKSLWPAGQPPPEAVALGADPGLRQADLAKGRAVFEKLGCGACHGAHGRANGTSSATLTDNWGAAIRPANLTQSWNYRGGGDPRSIVARMISGIDGTPMPSYAEAVTPEEAWQLAYYVQSLQEPTQWAIIARVSPTAGALPSAPEDPQWDAVPAWTVRVRPAVNATGEVTAPPTVNAVVLQALFDEQAIAFRLSWDDPTESRHEPPDAIALALRPRSVDGDVVTLQAWPLADSPPLDLCVWVAGPSTADTSSAAGTLPPGSSAATAQAYERLSRSYESALKPTGNGHPLALKSRARYDDGRWTVVMRRPLSVADRSDAATLEAGKFAPIAFVVWDGGNPGQRVVSLWIDLALQRPSASAASAAATKRPWVGLASGLMLVMALVLVFRTRK